jgi:WD40 repeat protein
MTTKSTILALAVVAGLLAGGCKEEKPDPATIVDSRSGQFPPPPPGPSRRLNSVAFSHDSKYLLLGYIVSRGEGGSRSEQPLPYLRLVDMSNGEILHSWLQEEDKVGVGKIRFFPDGRRALVHLNHAEVLFDVAARKIVWRKNLGIVATSPDGKLLYSQQGGEVKVWHVAAETPILVQTVAAKTVEGDTLQIHPPGALYDNRRVLAWKTRQADDTAHFRDAGEVKYWIWDLAAGTAQQVDLPAGLPSYYLQARSPDGKYLLFRKHHPLWAQKEDFRLWDVEAGKLVDPSKDNWKSPVVVMDSKHEQVPGGALPVTYARYWDVAAGSESRPPLKDIVSAEDILPDGKRALRFTKPIHYVGPYSSNTRICLWDVDIKGTEIWCLED